MRRGPTTTTTTTPRGRAGLAAGALALLVAASCGTASPPSAAGSAGSGPVDPAASNQLAAPPSTESDVVDLIAGRPYRVAHESRTFVDRTRPTPAGHPGGVEPPGPIPSGSAERTLVTSIAIPDGDGPFPVILFSHGLSGHPDKFSSLLDAWTAAGYITVAPAFPLTNDRVPGNDADAFDLWEQPQDISFVLDQVLAASREPGDSLQGKVDGQRLGAAGLSLGGATTYALIYNDCCRDERFIAAEVLSGALLPMSGEYDLHRALPILIMHGDHDLSLAYSGAVTAFAGATGPKMFVTLLGGTHSSPFENDPSPYDALAEKITTDFWDVHLLGDRSGADQLSRDAVHDGLTTVQTG